MSDRWYVMLSDLKEGDIQRLIDSTDGYADIQGDEDCFGVIFSFALSGDFYWSKGLNGYLRVNRTEALDKMGIEP